MPIDFACPHCGAVLRVKDTSAGRTVRCGRCSATSQAPDGVADVPAALPVAEPLDPTPDVRPPVVPAELLEEGVRGRPHRSTARPDRPARRRGPALWALTVALVVGFVAAACGGVVAVVGQPRWRTHESDAGGFRVELPAAPRGDMARLARANPNPDVHVEGTLLSGRIEEFVVCYGDRPPDAGVLDTQAVLKEVVEQLPQTLPGARVVRHEPVVVSGFPGVEALVEGGGVRACLVRVVLAEQRLYVVAAGGRFTGRDSGRLRRFVESFEVTDPQLLARARDRREAPRRAAERAEAERALAEEQRRLAAEARLRDEDARWAAWEAAERAYSDSLQRARDAFRADGPPGRTAPDPAAIPGLVYHLGFDGPDSFRPRSAEPLTIGSRSVAGTGARGSGVYLTAQANVTSFTPDAELRTALNRPLTLAGWFKLRYRPVTLFHFEGPNRSGAHLTVGGTQVVFDVSGHRNDATSHPVRAGGSVAAGDWQLDDRWHHVAAVREVRDGQVWSVLYLDGRRIAEAVTGPGWPLGAVSRLTVGQGAPAVRPAWPGPIGPPDRSGTPQIAGNDEMAYGLDEICVYDRPLSEAEVRVLAGVDPVPAANLAKPADPPKKVPAVALAAGAPLPAVAGFAFDPDRKTAWAVTQARDELVRYSYPELKEEARYRLSVSAGPVAFDPDGNRLFVAARLAGRVDPMRPAEAREGRWAVCRFDLDDLPNAGALVRPTAQSTAEPGEITALALSPDGKWVYGIGARGVPGLGNNAGVPFRAPAELRGNRESAGGPVPEAREGGHRLEVVPAGPAVWVAVHPRESLRAREWCRIDPATGREIDRLPFPVLRPEPVDWVAHPAGDRVFTLSENGGVVELRPGKIGTLGIRPVVAAPAAQPKGAAGHLGISPDGRFLFRAAAGALTVTDTAAPAGATGVAPSGELAVGAAVGPFWLSPDATVLVFRSGQVVRVSYPDGLAPKPVRAPRPAAARAPRPPLAPAPREVIPPEVLARTAPPPRPKLTVPPVARAAAAYGGGPVPAATEFEGLKFYLDFEARDGGRLKDAVSGSGFGRLYRAEPTDGVRGKGLRLSFAGKEASRQPGLDLSDAAEVLRVPAGRPFTLSLWVRPVQGQASALVASRRSRPAEKVVAGRLMIGAFMGTGTGPDAVTALLGGDDSQPKAGRAITGDRRFPDRGRWHHVALVRDEKGAVRLLVDGEESRQRTSPDRFGGSFSYDQIWLGSDLASRDVVVDVDEFCLFDRALTDDELKRLGGRAK